MKNLTKRQNLILSYLRKVGDKWRYNEEIIVMLELNGFGRLSSKKIRSEIHTIRLVLRWGFIIASGSGYKYTEDAILLDSYYDQLRDRIKSQQDILDALVQIKR